MLHTRVCAAVAVISQLAVERAHVAQDLLESLGLFHPGHGQGVDAVPLRSVASEGGAIHEHVAEVAPTVPAKDLAATS